MSEARFRPGWTLAASILASSLAFVAGNATLVTEPSTNARLEARIEAARVQPGRYRGLLMPISRLLVPAHRSTSAIRRTV